ncbi:uncharacterized protein VTP21DRAFT_9310 [Calcarisporiella thermophila]|uniref:uncharacterized protein n=1 Tax=Calcarisporiella thermophila TaxID=911321 RepID=UPI0037444548
MATEFITTFGAAVTVPAALLTYFWPNRAIGSDYRPDIPHPPEFPLVGSLPDLIAMQGCIHDFISAAHQILGQTWYFFLFFLATLSPLLIVLHSWLVRRSFTALLFPRQIMTIDARNVEHVLKNKFENYSKGDDFHTKMFDMFGDGIFNANGEKWRYQRKTASHIFNVKNFRDWFTGVFLDEAKIAFKILDERAANLEEIDLNNLFYRYTLESFLKIGFGTAIDAMDMSKDVQFAKSFDFVQSEIGIRQVQPLWRITETFSSLFFPSRRLKKHVKVVDEFAHKIIQERRNNPDTTKQDLLSRFIFNTKNENGEPLSDKELRDIVLNFIIAGRDTTAGTLAWTFYCLMNHPEVEAKVYEEVCSQIGDRDELEPQETYEVVKRLTYTTAVWNEVLRLFPSVPLNQKMAMSDDFLPDGTFVKKGDHVVWSSYSMGRNEAIWGPDAREFKPERWLKENERKPSAFEWPAFNAGPRTCLGQMLATIEGVLVIALLVKRYRFRLVPDQTIMYAMSLTLPMKEGMKVIVEKRKP